MLIMYFQYFIYKKHELVTLREQLVSPLFYFVGATFLVLLAFCFFHIHSVSWTKCCLCL